MRITLLLIAILLSFTSYAADSKDEMGKEIMHLFNYLKNADCEFNRNGKWYDAKEAAKHINKKYRYLDRKDLINSTEQFIDQAASKSSMSGKSYMVKCGKSEPIKSSVWFKRELSNFREKDNSNRWQVVQADIKPFADSTASLSAAAGTYYHEVASDVASLKPFLIAGEKVTDTRYQTRKQQLESTQKIFEETDKNLNTLFSAMTTYSEKLANLTAAGEAGAEAGQSILDSVQGFAELAGMSGLPLSSAAAPITQGFKAIADEFTKMEAKDSLKEAVAAADQRRRCFRNGYAGPCWNRQRTAGSCRCGAGLGQWPDRLRDEHF